MYQAKVCAVRTRPHPNADKIQLGNAGGYQVVISKDVQDKTLGLFFQADGQLSEQFAAANDLVSYTKEDGTKGGGFFDKNRRVRIQSFRKEKSEGFWIPLSSLSSFGDISSLSEGDMLDSFFGTPICNKYFTPKTLQVMGVNQKKQQKENLYLSKHMDTLQFRDNGRNIKPGSILTVTEKLHGTSARVGYVPVDNSNKMSFWKKLYRRLKGIPDEEYEVVVGTRNVLLKSLPKEVVDAGASVPEGYRHWHASRFSDRLLKNEIVYYELVGYTNTGASIMGQHDLSGAEDVDSKTISKRYGKKIVYSYGCNEGQCDGYVYRITNVSPDGKSFDLSDSMMRKRCEQLGLKPVPIIKESFIYDGDLDKLTKSIVRDDVLEGLSATDNKTMKEGVVIRVDGEDGVYFLKIKSFSFSYLESIAKTFDHYCDLEEVS